MRVAILQPNYIPWRGYFALLASVDRFILLENVQYTKQDWRNRNRIKTPQGLQWLTVPVMVQSLGALICDVRIADRNWGARHWRTLEMNYRRSSHFAEVAEWLAPLYLNRDFGHLISMNRAFLDAILKHLGIGTPISSSCDYVLPSERTERLVALCNQVGASVYVSGPAARDYLQEELFNQRGIAVEWFDYSGLPNYPQLWGGYEPQASIVDLLFNCGVDARRYLGIEGATT